MEKENNSVLLSQPFNIYSLILSESPKILYTLLKKHTKENKKFETISMFQGIELINGKEYNRRIYKTEMDTPFLVLEEETRIVKLYTLTNDLNRAAIMLQNFLINYRDNKNRIRKQEETYENQAIDLCY
jgi:hypothetical protein